MKLILKEYLASLRERDELDAILPDLLSQMGLNVFSRPGRGTRQDGVDVAAFGRLGSDPEKVYLFSIKPGDLSRKSWDGEAVQSLRPSLNEILDVYVPSRLPEEHKGKPIVICICVGGDIQEQVRPQLKFFFKKNESSNISFEEWNGDKLAALIQANFLREDLLPVEARSQLRKSLAMLDEPDVSAQHFAALIRSLSAVDEKKDGERVTALRQISICLWILFSWGREAGNLESAYLSGELALLYGWKIANQYAGKKNKVSESVKSAFASILSAYRQIAGDYLTKNVLPHVDKLHGLSSAVHASDSLDVNLKLFDILGRLALEGVWSYWTAQKCSTDQAETKAKCEESFHAISDAVKALISNNPALFLPIKDSQVIDISMAVLVLAINIEQRGDLKNWLMEITHRAAFAYRTHGHYPCTLESYNELLEHPKAGDDVYRRSITPGSVLYPMIALWAAIFEFDELYTEVAEFKEKHLQHCTFQFWYPDETSEAHFYTNGDHHGAALTDIPLGYSKKELLDRAFEECGHSPQFRTLSAVSFSMWPLILVACRHYRLPLPIHLFEGFCVADVATEGGSPGEDSVPAS